MRRKERRRKGQGNMSRTDDGRRKEERTPVAWRQKRRKKIGKGNFVNIVII